MQRIHLPRIDARYWLAILLASVFGTNMGDLYAHESGLGIVWGLLLLAILALGVFVAERGDTRPRELYYWGVIVIIRTGATNIADWLAFRVRVPEPGLALALAGLLALFAWGAQPAAEGMVEGERLPTNGTPYWLAMLSAGVFGTVVGDVASHLIGQGPASIALGVLLAAVLAGRRSVAAASVAAYWVTVAVARTAGTAMGDWLAEDKVLEIGLPVSTLITGTVFVLVLGLWRSRSTPVPRER